MGTHVHQPPLRWFPVELILCFSQIGPVKLACTQTRMPFRQIVHWLLALWLHMQHASQTIELNKYMWQEVMNKARSHTHTHVTLLQAANATMPECEGSSTVMLATLAALHDQSQHRQTGLVQFIPYRSRSQIQSANIHKVQNLSKELSSKITSLTMADLFSNVSFQAPRHLPTCGRGKAMTHAGGLAGVPDGWVGSGVGWGGVWCGVGLGGLWPCHSSVVALLTPVPSRTLDSLCHSTHALPT